MLESAEPVDEVQGEGSSAGHETMTTSDAAACLTDNELSALAEDALSPDHSKVAWAHLSSCDDCATLFHQLMNHAWADLTTVPFQLRAPADPLEGRREVGRYRVVSVIARGGMGVVYLAFDPELERRVALKVLPPTHQHDELARGRMLREAQALARLTHPNVTAIYDVGTVGDSIFFAMEFIEGQTLRDWLNTPRSWREVVRVFLEAGAGLSAAHRGRLVHRDFKPSNVLIGTDGHARVTDFGIAKPEGAQDFSYGGALDTSFTLDGMVSGTVGYIAPELVSGGEATAASDQFGFCAALFEALARRRPFAGSTLAAFVEALDRPLEVPSSVPRWLAHVVRRGLSRKPSERYRSLDELLAVLKRGLGRRRRLLIASAVALGIAIVAASLVALISNERQACFDRTGRLARSWDERLRERFANEPLLERLAHQAAAYRSVQNEVCRLGQHSTESAPERCLAGHRLELEATASILSNRRAMIPAAIHALEDPSRCLEARHASAPSLGAARALVGAHIEDWPLTLAEARAAIANEAPDASSALRARVLEATALGVLGRIGEAQAKARQTLLDSLARGEDEAALRACVTWAETSTDVSQVLEASQLGEALHARLPGDRHFRHLRTELERIGARAQGDRVQARRLAEQALTERRALGSLHPSLVRALLAVADAAETAGDRPRALEAAREAARLGRALFEEGNQTTERANGLVSRLETSGE